MTHYNTSIVTLFDILGFKKIVLYEEPSVVYAILDELLYRSEPDPILANLFEHRFAHFSDTVVRTKNIKSEANQIHRTGILWDELDDLVQIQSNMIKRGILIRGAVTIGDIFHDKDYIYGPGLIEAYELESRIAIYPRIILDPKVLHIVEHTKLLLPKDFGKSEELQNLKTLLRHSSDGVWFIDYLDGPVDDRTDFQTACHRFKAHKDLILHLSCGKEQLTDLSVKFNWMAQYHNEVILEYTEKEYSSQGYSKDDLLILSNEMPTLYDFEDEDEDS